MDNDIIHSKAHKQFAVNVFSNTAVYMLTLLIWLWFTPYLIKNLGVAAYGLIPLATSVTSYLSLLTLSINGAVGRFLAIDIQKEDSENAKITFNTAFIGLLTIAIVTLPMLLGLVTILPRVFNIPSGAETTSKVLFFLVMCFFFIKEIDACFAVSSWAKSRFDLRSIVSISSSIMQIFFVVILFSLLKPNLVYVGVGILGSGIVNFIGDFVLWRKLTPELQIQLRKFDWTRLRELFGMGGWVVINQIGTLLFLNIDLIVANKVFGAELAGEYASVLVFSTVLRGVAGAISNVLYPTIVAKFAQNDMESVNRLSTQAVRLLGFAVCLPVGLLCGLGSSFLGLWLGPNFSHLGFLLTIMICHLPINLAVLPLFGIQMAMNKVKIPGLVTLFMGTVNLTLAILFTTVFKWGLYGIAIAGGIALTLKNAIFTPLYSSYIQKKAWHSYIFSIIPGVALTVGIGLIAWLVSSYIRINTWGLFILSCSILIALSGAFIYLFGFKPKDKKLFLSYMPELKK